MSDKNLLPDFYKNDYVKRYNDHGSYFIHKNRKSDYHDDCGETFMYNTQEVKFYVYMKDGKAFVDYDTEIQLLDFIAMFWGYEKRVEMLYGIIRYVGRASNDYDFCKVPFTDGEKRWVVMTLGSFMGNMILHFKIQNIKNIVSMYEDCMM